MNNWTTSIDSGTSAASTANNVRALPEPPKSDIASEMDRLREESAAAYKLTSELAQRLAIVCRASDQPIGATPVPAGPSTQVGQSLRQISDELSQVNALLRDLMNRLEL